MKNYVKWQPWEGRGLEHCRFFYRPTGLILEGSVVGNRESEYGAFYTVKTDELFKTREVRVKYADGPELYISSDGKGNWYDHLNNNDLDELAGCFDVDISFTPATNTLPLQRLNLHERQSAEIFAAYVPLPSQIAGDFLPKKVSQRYTCLKLRQLYRYEGIFRDFVADLRVDSDMLVTDYPDTFRRIYN